MGVIQHFQRARHRLFTTGSRSLEQMPPTRAALFQHVKHYSILNISEWGYYKDTTSTWQPLWTTLSNISVMHNSLALRLPQGLHDQVQMQACWFQCRALCKCADECITGTKEHTPRLSSHHICHHDLVTLKMTLPAIQSHPVDQLHPKDAVYKNESKVMFE